MRISLTGTVGSIVRSDNPDGSVDWAFEFDVDGHAGQEAARVTLIESQRSDEVDLICGDRLSIVGSVPNCFRRMLSESPGPLTIRAESLVNHSRGNMEWRKFAPQEAQR